MYNSRQKLEFMRIGRGHTDRNVRYFHQNDFSLYNPAQSVKTRSC